MAFLSLVGPLLVSLVDRFSGAFGRRFFIPVPLSEL